MRSSVAILGATGVVGQKAIALLENNPFFSVGELVASESKIGKKFIDVCDWKEPLMLLPEKIAVMDMIDINNIQSQFVVSCLPGEIAEKTEYLLASKGKIVFSNASAFRMHKEVPLVIPEINSSHLSLINLQPTLGKIITNPNCVVVGVALALAPLLEIGEVEHVSVVTMQSVSGAGYPGVPALDILGNSIPYIKDEANKITAETKRILGSAEFPVSFAVTTHVHRVPIAYGHTITLHITFKETVDSLKAIEKYKEWNYKHQGLFVLHQKNDRPQVIKDLRHDDMRAHIGNLIVGDKSNILGLVVLTNNLVRGAAGAVIGNMEAYLKFQGKKK